MADRSITIRLSANVQGLQAGFKTAQRAATDFASQTEKFAQNNRQSLEQVGQAGMVMGGGLVAGFGLAVTKFASFDKAMSSVRAATHATEGDMDLLREAAIRTGADTAFSAEEAARGIEEMAKAGVSTADILNGGLDGALALAAAGALDVGEAAELASTAMTQFGLSGEDIPHIADLLAAGAGKAQGSVQDMGSALKQAGLVADQTGLTIEETTGGLAAFAAAGLVGSDAGTSFKSMLQRLTPQSKEAADLMEELGLSAYDSQGNFIGLSEYAGELQTALGDMTVEQRNSTMATLFGSDAVRAAAVLYENGASGVQKWEDAVNDAGYAAETAALMQDNLAGDLEKLGGAFDTVFLKSGSGANDALRGLVQTLEDVMDAVGEIPAPVLNAVTAIAGISGGLLLAGGAFVTFVPKIADTVGAFNNLRTNAPRAASALGKLSKAAGLASAAFVGFEILKTVHNNMQPAVASVEEMTQALIAMKDGGEGMDEVFSSIDFGSGSSMVGEIDGIGEAAEKLASSGLRDSIQRFGADVLGIDNGMSKLRGTFEAADAAMAGLATSGSLDIAAAGFRDAAEGMGSMEEAAAMLPDYVDSLRSMASDAGVAVTEQELLNWAMGEVPAAMEAAAGGADEVAVALEEEAAAAEEAAVASEAMQEALAEIGLSADGTIASLETFIGVLQNSGLMTLSARDASRNFEAAIDSIQPAIDDLIAKHGGLGEVLNDTATGFRDDTEAGREAGGAFDAVASAGANMAQSMADAGGTQEELQGQLGTTYDSLITAAGQFGITGGAADLLARNVMGIPAEANIDTWMSDEAKLRAEATTAAMDTIPGEVDIHTFMSSDANDMALTTKTSADDVPDQVTIDSWMGDAAFIEALRTRAAALNVPPDVAVDSFMSSAARNEADDTTAKVLNIPKGTSISSYMSAAARWEAENLKGALDAVDGRVTVSTSYMDVITRRSVVDMGARPGQALKPGQIGLGGYTGGRVREIMGFYSGGKVPGIAPANPREDNVLAMVNGEPLKVRSGEWIINEDSSRKHDSLLAAINRDDPMLGNMRGMAGGGQVMQSRQYAPSSSSGGSMRVDIDYAQLAAAMQSQPINVVGQIDGRELFRFNQNAPSQFRAKGRG